MAKLPEALLTVFGIVVFSWLWLQQVSLVLTVSLSVVILAGLHLAAPKHPITTIGLAYLVGAAIAGFLIFGLLTAPIGGTPEAVAAFYRVAVPMIVLYIAALIALVVKLL